MGASASKDEDLDSDSFCEAFRRAPRGGGMDVLVVAYEHLQPMIANRAHAEALCWYCDALAQGATRKCVRGIGVFGFVTSQKRHQGQAQTLDVWSDA